MLAHPPDNHFPFIFIIIIMHGISALTVVKERNVVPVVIGSNSNSRPIVVDVFNFGPNTVHFAKGSIKLGKKDEETIEWKLGEGTQIQSFGQVLAVTHGRLYVEIGEKEIVALLVRGTNDVAACHIEVIDLPE